VSKSPVVPKTTYRVYSITCRTCLMQRFLHRIPDDCTRFGGAGLAERKQTVGLSQVRSRHADKDRTLPPVVGAATIKPMMVVYYIDVQARQGGSMIIL